MSERLRLVTHNVWVGQPPGELRANLARLAADTDRPHAIAVQEARRLAAPPTGYVRVHAGDVAEHPDDLGMQLVVREDVTVIRRRLVPAGGPWWVGPKHGIRHPPKLFVGATIEHGGQRWDLLSIHRCWTGGMRRNTEAWEAEHQALRSWCDARRDRWPGRPIVLAGDWNGRRADIGRHSIGQLAHQTGGRLTMRGIDGALTIGVATVTARRLTRLYGSDGHRPVAVTATT